MHDTETDSNDDFMPETSGGKAKGKAKKISLAGKYTLTLALISRLSNRIRIKLIKILSCLVPQVLSFFFLEEDTDSSESSEDEANETGIVLSAGNPQPKNKYKTDGQKIRYNGFETRTTPNTLTEVVRTLTNPQRVAVGSMGLDGMLHFGITKVPTQFAKWLLESFNSKTCKLETPRGDAEILPKDVNFTLGLPMGGRLIKVPLRTIPDTLLVQTFRLQYGGPRANKIKCTEVSDMIQASNEANDTFKLNFYSTIVDSTKTGKGNQRILNAIEGIDDIRALNWGDFVIKRLRHTKDEWEKNKGNPYIGPMPLLMALYLDRFQDRLVKFERTILAIMAINDDVIDQRIKSEMNQGGFRRHVTLLKRNAPPEISDNPRKSHGSAC
ncbi:hypothetical protein QQ045_028081 [Rhodiola kirilowii]